MKLAEVRKDRGYKGPALNASAAASGGKGRGKAAIAAKKASGKHLCFDCGLPGHWSGDPECTKPGAGLGRAKGKAAPAKQVRIAEACGDANHTVAEVETLNTGENEVLMAMSLSAALRAGSSGQTSEALVTSALAKDKALVGALDSACNRTCAGEDWIQGYLLELQKAPPEIQALVKTVEEQENFKFGNGGNLPSMTRYRVPAVISGHLVGIWISCVPVSSLGLLLGRDLLDGLGGVLDFSQRTLTCKLFANRPPVALERLAAGHLSLALIPEQWPAVTQGRWRKLGADGVLECCIGCAEWAAHLLHMNPRRDSEDAPHSHNMTEATLELGRLAFHAVLCASAQNCEMTFAEQPQPSTCTTAFGPTVGNGGSEAFGGSLENSSCGTSRPGSRRLGRRQVAEDDVASGGKIRLEPRRSTTVVRQASRAALVAISLSLCVLGGAMAAAGRWHGGQWMLPSEVAGPRSVQSGDLGFFDVVSQPRRLEVCVPGGSGAEWDAGCALAARPDEPHQECSHQGGSSSIGARDRSTPGSPYAAWAKRGDTHAQGRLVEARSPLAHRGGRQGHGADHQRQTAAAGGRSLCKGSFAGDLFHRLRRALRAGVGGTFGTTLDERIVRDYVTWAIRDSNRGRYLDKRPTQRCHDCCHAEQSPDPGHGAAFPGAGTPPRGHAQPGHAPHHADAREPEPRRGHDEQRVGAGPATGLGPSPQPARMPRGEPGRPLKAGQRQLIRQAWDKHRRDQMLISCSPRQVRQAMLTEVAMQYRKAIHDAFVMEIPLLCTDAVGFNDSVGRCARTRGHITGANLGPEAGWDSYSLATNSKLYDSCNAKSLTS